MIGNKAWYIAACRNELREQLIGNSNGLSSSVRRERIVLPAMSPGTERSLHVLRFGAEGARPKAYLQASLHADELPAMLVLNHLIERLSRAAGDGAVRGEVVVVPVANPIGLAQFVQGRAMGRFALAGSGNFNRHFPDLAQALDENIAGRLSDDGAANVSVLRAAMGDALAAMQPADEVACCGSHESRFHRGANRAHQPMRWRPLWPQRGPPGAPGKSAVQNRRHGESGRSPYRRVIDRLSSRWV